MKLSREKKLAIVNALDINNQNSILSLIIQTIQRVVQRYVGSAKASPPRYLVMEYLMDDEGLSQFQRDLTAFDDIADDLCLYGDEETEDGEIYFNFNEDVVSIPDLIRKHVTAKDGILSYNIEGIYNSLEEAVAEYRNRVLIPLGGYYFYYKDHLGHEKCEYVFENLQEHKWRFLNTLAEDCASVPSPISIISKDEWVRIITKGDTDFNKKSFTQAVKESPATIPFIVITHRRCFKPDEEFTVVQTLRDVDWDALIEEYAEPHAFQKGPQYIAGKDITAEIARECDMPALATEIERIEALFL